MAEEWTGLWVCMKGCFQTRHPQDFVESVPDDPSVPVSRPDVVQSVGDATLENDILIWTTGAFIIGGTGLAEKDPIGIEMDNGATHWSFIESLETLSSDPLIDADGELVLDANGDPVSTTDEYPAGYTIVLNTPVSYLCNMGNAVYLPSLNNEEWQ